MERQGLYLDGGKFIFRTSDISSVHLLGGLLRVPSVVNFYCIDRISSAMNQNVTRFIYQAGNSSLMFFIMWLKLQCNRVVPNLWELEEPRFFLAIEFDLYFYKGS